jgi:hypothetical protein
MTSAFVVPQSRCLHLDQGGDLAPDAAFSLVVPTGNHTRGLTCGNGRLGVWGCVWTATTS